MRTKYGIYLDLQSTPYKAKYGKNIFYFSSELHLQKFTTRIAEYVTMEIAKFQIRYNTDITLISAHLEKDLEIYFAVSLYKKIENRGFRVENEMEQKRY